MLGRGWILKAPWKDSFTFFVCFLLDRVRVVAQADLKYLASSNPPPPSPPS
jgi:hypothetical protein